MAPANSGFTAFLASKSTHASSTFAPSKTSNESQANSKVPGVSQRDDSMDEVNLLEEEGLEEKSHHMSETVPQQCMLEEEDELQHAQTEQMV